MAIVDLVMPKMGESITEATVLKWHKQPGDTVKMDETVLEIATDKVDSEVPSTNAGVITEILFKVNDVVPVGSTIARIDTAPGQSQATAPNTPQPQPEVTTAPVVKEIPVAAPVAAPAQQSATPVSFGPRFYSPLVLNIAGKEGVSMTELESIPGTGNEGRVTKKDILDYVAGKGKMANAQPDGAVQQTQIAMSNAQPVVRQEPVVPVPPVVQVAQPQPVQIPTINNTVQQQPATPATVVPKAPVTTAPAVVATGNVEIMEMDRMRRMIADHMVRSKATSPHVTSFTEADVTNIVLWREREKANFEKKYGEKITFTPLFFEAVANVIRRYPLVNCSLDGTNIIIKKDINIGMATALPTGNLIVPVIRNADTKNLFGLSKEVNALANAARANKLKPDDTQGGTFTITNVGSFGSLMGTPIINQPQVAILALGAIKKRPMVMETPEGDVIAIRHMMYLSLSYDHRIVDGALGATFLTAVANEFEAFDANRKI